jgi:integration host factor subunit alpha
MKTNPPTITRADLAARLSKEFGLPRTDGNRIVAEVLREIIQGLARDRTVRLARFGSWLVRAKVGRIGRNPRTGVSAIITPRSSVTFIASGVMKAAANRRARPAAHMARFLVEPPA